MVATETIYVFRINLQYLANAISCCCCFTVVVYMLLGRGSLHDTRGAQQPHTVEQNRCH